MKKLLFILALLSLLPAAPVFARGCVGGQCNVCTSCSSCKHCAKEGGTCSVKTGGKATPRTVTPARSAPVAPTSKPVPRIYAPPEPHKDFDAVDLDPSQSAPPIAPQAAIAPGSGTASAAVYFSPNGGAQDAIIKEIDAAKEWIRIQAYSYTSAPISEALLRAHKRGVKIKAVLDKSNQTAQYTGATFLTNAGIPVLVDSKHAIAHSKIMILDGGTPNATIITGSFNFTKAAESSNSENLLVLKNCPALVEAYSANFRAHEAHSTPYARKP